MTTERERRIEHARQARHASGSVTGSGPVSRGPSAPQILPGVWDDRDGWPLETSDLVFLATAILQLGRTQHGPSWAAPAAERAAAARPIVQACVDGALRSFSRDKRGGEALAITSGAWFRDDWQVLTDACAIRVRDDEPAWIYVEGDGLRQLLEKVVLTQDWHPLTQTAEVTAEIELEKRAADWAAGRGPVPVKRQWIDDMKPKIGERPAGRVWNKVAVRYPGIRSNLGKPRPRRPG